MTLLEDRIKQLTEDLSFAESDKQQVISLLEKSQEIRASLEESLENERKRNAEFQLELAQLRDVATVSQDCQSAYFSRRRVVRYLSK